MRSLFIKGDRVYCRRSDLFGIIQEYESAGAVFVKWEWPVDPDAPADKVDSTMLCYASEVA